MALASSRPRGPARPHAPTTRMPNPKRSSSQAVFDDKEFYAFADAAGSVHIRWIDALPEGWSILGRVLYTQVPHVVKPGSGGGFAETNDEFEF